MDVPYKQHPHECSSVTSVPEPPNASITSVPVEPPDDPESLQQGFDQSNSASGTLGQEAHPSCSSQLNLKISTTTREIYAVTSGNPDKNVLYCDCKEFQDMHSYFQFKQKR
jgi:hypothetical protein